MESACARCLVAAYSRKPCRPPVPRPSRPIEAHAATRVSGMSAGVRGMSACGSGGDGGFEGFKGGIFFFFVLDFDIGGTRISVSKAQKSTFWLHQAATVVMSKTLGATGTPLPLIV